MIAIISLLLVLVLSLLVTKVAAIALTFTGLSRQSARFQARSAFTGVGFTTSESEKVVNHPVRRKILLIIMLVGNAGIVTVISTFILGFIQVESGGALISRVLLLAGGVAFLITVSMSSWMEKGLSRLVTWALKKYTDLDVRDYAAVLHLAGEYAIHDVFVQPTDWMAGKPLAELQLPHEGVLVLGIHRQDDRFLGAPKGDTVVEPYDTLTLYGRVADIARLDRRRKGPGGNIQHAEAVARRRNEEEESSLKPRSGSP